MARTRPLFAEGLVRSRDHRAGSGVALSFWLETAGDLTPRPPLDGSVDVDVAVLGAGYTGLWTAYELLRREPRLRVAVAERAYAGFGASGRNGGWCSSDLSLGLGGLTRRYGRDGARALQVAMFDTVDEIGRVCAAEEIDAQFEKGGMLLVARGPHQLADLVATHEEYVAAGFGDRFSLLDAAEAHERVRVADVEAAIATDECAVVHPGRLVRGLAAAVERRGGVIYEDTPVTGFDTGSAPRLHTPHGVIHARTIVLAGEAYLTQFRRLHRRLLPVYSLIVLTEPIDDAVWDEIGWRRRECLASMRLTVDYFSRTADGRIVVGGRGAPYHYGSRVEPAFDDDAATHEMLRASLARWFPVLAGVRFTHAWGGPLGMSRDWLPAIQHDRRTGVALAAGYVGHGVATSNLAGRLLADLILERTSELTELPLAGHGLRSWPPEPARWGAVRYVQSALGHLDERGAATGRPRSGRSLAERLARH